MTYELGTFNTIQPSEYDLATGNMLTPANLVMLQNLRATYAQDVLNLELDINKHLEYAVALASLQANIKLIGYLMDSHKLAVESQETNSPE